MTPADPRGAALSRVALAGAAWLGALSTVSSLALLGLNVHLNRALPDAPREMDLWMLVLRVQLIASLALEGGLPTVLVQRHGLSARARGAIAFLQVALGAAGAVLVALLAPALAGAFPDQPQERLAGLIRLAAPSLLLSCLGLPQRAVLERALSFRVVALVEGVAGLLFVALGVLGGPRWGAEALVVALVARHVVEAALLWALGGLPWREVARWVPWREWREHAAHVRFGLAMAAQTIVGTVARTGDALLVALLVAPPALALFGQAQAFLTLPLGRLLAFVARAAFPTFALVQDDRERTLRGLARLQRLSSLAVFPMLFGAAAVAPRLMALVLGPQYAPYLGEAVLALRLLAIPWAAYSFAYTLGWVANAAGTPRPLLLAQVWSLVLLVGLMALGSPWGFVGACAGRALAGVLSTLVLLKAADRLLGFTPRDAWRSCRVALVASAGSYVAVAALGLGLDRAWPASAAAAPVAGAESAALVALALQVAAGVVAYVALLRVHGVAVLVEIGQFRQRGGTGVGPNAVGP